MALGAGLGAVLRYLLLMPAAAGSGMEIALVLALNAIGCAAMGWFRPGPFWGMGVLGGFTTFSAVTLAAATTSAIGALAILVVSFATCVGAWLAADALRERHA